ncbi:pentatricopeptide repeat-containing protein at5g18950-like protein [Trifolium pratense]|uniref:Pentatricopeptide repeat-containing protein at5g18950-like protein n=1 Tax=Trifolium pratense TaxID=57577 RepID=A0A2K3PH50_TRIPR|nr:pentatricopeptide repeat-containing protein at5g18950-like protein [Trifolium pratense]
MVSYTTMISGLFHEMSRKGVARDLTSYNSLIKGLCQKGELVKATDLLHELLAHGLEPSVSSFTPLIKKLCEVGDIEEGNLTQGMEWLLFAKHAELEAETQGADI